MASSSQHDGNHNIPPRKISEQITSSSNSAQGSENRIVINDFLKDLLKELNERDVDAIQKHLDMIKKVLKNEIEDFDKILFAGSVSKNTFINGTSDIDALVFLNSDKYKGASPKELKENLYELLKARFPSTEIRKGDLAVTLKFKDYEIQLLPALRENKRIRIANRDGTHWSNLINIDKFREKLTLVNRMNGNLVVPAIKIAKYLLNKLPSEYQLSGYHIEAIATEAFTNYNGSYTYFDATKHLLNYMETRVHRQIVDVTGQSGIIDEYLGPDRSITRQKCSLQIKEIRGSFESATNIGLLQKLFTEEGR